LISFANVSCDVASDEAKKPTMVHDYHQAKCGVDLVNLLFPYMLNRYFHKILKLFASFSLFVMEKCIRKSEREENSFKILWKQRNTSDLNA